jgi:hypothetical protein
MRRTLSPPPSARTGGKLDGCGRVPSPRPATASPNNAGDFSPEVESSALASRSLRLARHAGHGLGLALELWVEIGELG